MGLKRSKCLTKLLLKGILFKDLKLRAGSHLPFPLVEGGFHDLEIAGVESISAPKFQLELVLPLNKYLSAKVDKRPLPELSNK